MLASHGLVVYLVLWGQTSLAAPSQPAVRAPAGMPFEIKGRVVDEADKPVAGAIVESLDLGKTVGTVTDPNGGFALQLAQYPKQRLRLRAATPDKTAQAFASHLVKERVALPTEFKLVVRSARKVEVAVVDDRSRSSAVGRGAFDALPQRRRRL